jgi:hypothetical protein
MFKILSKSELVPSGRRSGLCGLNPTWIPPLWSHPGRQCLVPPPCPGSPPGCGESRWLRWTMHVCYRRHTLQCTPDFFKWIGRERKWETGKKELEFHIFIGKPINCSLLGFRIRIRSYGSVRKVCYTAKNKANCLWNPSDRLQCLGLEIGQWESKIDHIIRTDISTGWHWNTVIKRRV